ncbi:T9SS type A sorting domain-containing protein [Chryseobacterium sp. MEBOG07]|uniref:T9SS type A sorting domain-containing protein n=1 Tax=Chryseobacterium sp. MEBOG07 TaxID=2879939 RepID=UPI001F339090|nr:T9SS type A sorting domain-containing protein [Chryseobacterium sp. MEBOG07]UKB77378.1 T9SS type A sorting domain-containing protein [Chryseobacterium sp. MEBOG07]
MYKKQLIIIFFFLFFISYAQTEFITLWKPNVNGTIDNSITFGGTGTSYTISWEEVGYPQHSGLMNSVTSNSSSPITISFGTSLNTNPLQATYKLKVSNGSGLFYGFRASPAYPNPTTGVITVESTENENVYVYDITGKIIKNMTLNKGKNSIDLTGYPSGNYLLKGNHIFTKIIKK